MDLTVNVSKNRLNEQTDFANMFKEADSPYDKTYIMYTDSSADYMVSGQLNYRNLTAAGYIGSDDMVVGISAGNAVTDIDAGIFESMPNLSSVSVSRRLSAGFPDFTACTGIRRADLSPYTKQEITDGWSSIFAGRDSDSPLLIVKCADGYLDDRYGSGPKDSTITLAFDDNEIEYAHTMPINGSACANCSPGYREDGAFHLKTWLAYSGSSHVNANLTAIDFAIGCNITYLPEEAFKYAGIHEITIPDGIDLPLAGTYIGYAAFDGCNNLISAVLPKKTKILHRYYHNWQAEWTIGRNRDGYYACIFGPESMTNIKYLKMPGITKDEFTNNVYNVFSFQPLIFGGYYDLPTIFGILPRSRVHVVLSDGEIMVEPTYKEISGGTGSNPCYMLNYEDYSQVASYFYDDDEKTYNFVIDGDLTRESEMVPDGVVKADLNYVNGIGDGALSGYNTLSAVEIDDMCVKLGKAAFRDDTALKSINIPTNNTAEIEESCFMNCQVLASIYLPKERTDVPAYAFCNCAALTSTGMPYGSIGTVGDYAFYNCGQLRGLDQLSACTSFGERCLDGALIKKEAFDTMFKNITSADFISSVTEKNILGDLNKSKALRDACLATGSYDYGTSTFTGTLSVACLNNAIVQIGLEYNIPTSMLTTSIKQ